MTKYDNVPHNVPVIIIPRASLTIALSRLTAQGHSSSFNTDWSLTSWRNWLKWKCDWRDCEPSRELLLHRTIPSMASHTSFSTDNYFQLENLKFGFFLPRKSLLSVGFRQLDPRVVIVLLLVDIKKMADFRVKLIFSRMFDKLKSC